MKAVQPDNLNRCLGQAETRCVFKVCRSCNDLDNTIGIPIPEPVAYPTVKDITSNNSCSYFPPYEVYDVLLYVSESGKKKKKERRVTQQAVCSVAQPIWSSCSHTDST